MQETSNLIPKTLEEKLKETNKHLKLPLTKPIFVEHCLHQQMTVLMNQDHKLQEIKQGPVTG